MPDSTQAIAAEDPRIKKILSRVAAIVAITLAIMPPLGYFALTYYAQVRELDAEAELTTHLATHLITDNPTSWFNDRTRVQNFVTQDYTNTETEAEARRLYGPQNQLLAEGGDKLRWPIISQSFPIEVDGQALGRFELSRSLSPIISHTILLSLISFFAGMNIFVIFYLLPLRALKRLLDALAEEKEKAVVTLASIGDAVITTDTTGMINYLNPVAEQLLGLLETKALGQPITQVVKIEDEVSGLPFADPLQHMDQALTAGNLVQSVRIKNACGQIHFVDLTLSPLRNAQQDLTGFVLVLHDTSMAHRAEQTIREREERLRVVIDNATDGIITLDDAGHIETFNPAAERIFGFNANDIYGWNLSALIPGINPIQHMHSGNISELAGLHQSGNSFSLEMSISEAFLGGAQKLVALVRDVTERKRTEERLLFLANYDSLTGLPNRVLFRDRLAHAMHHAHRNESLVILLFLDLDRFKYINDSLGHEAGDILLKHVAKRLIGTLRKSDTLSRAEPESGSMHDATVSRLGGDEFTIILEGVSHVDQAVMVAQKILDVFEKPFTLVDHEVFVSTSIGITVYPFDDIDLDLLIKNADTAMYRAKDLGRNNYQFYTEDMNTSVKSRMLMEGYLRYALERNEFSLHYQPQMDIKSGRVIGVETLLRWQNRELGSVDPSQFIPVLEDTGMIIAVGEWVLRTACLQVKSWLDAGLPDITVAVNLSARQFHQKNLAQIIAATLNDTALPSDMLELEITESLLMGDSESSIATLAELKAYGIKISVDDFGTGYSSLSYLKRFPIDVLKIDQSFVRDISSDPDDAAIAKAIIALAHSLRLTVIAEGVETTEQLEFLRAHDCDSYQGYFTSRPIPAEQLGDWLKAREQTAAE